MTETPYYRYLNRDGTWQGLQRRGLALRDGTLRLRSLPLAEEQASQTWRGLPLPMDPGGIAVASDGTVFFSEPEQHVIRRIDCKGHVGRLPCVAQGTAPGALTEPRGLAYVEGRGALVADSGNHRVQLLDAQTGQLLALWDADTLAGDDRDGAPPRPVAVAVATDGTIYVVDRDRRRVVKIGREGRLRPGFWYRVAASTQNGGETPLHDPLAVAIRPDGTEILILDGGSSPRVLAFDPDGSLIRPPLVLASVHHPMGLAVSDDALYLGDGDRVVEADPTEGIVGMAVGFRAPVAALALRGGAADQVLLVHSGSAGPPLPVKLEGAYVSSGLLWGGPFANPSARTEQWHRLSARISSIGDGTRVELLTSNTPYDPAMPCADRDSPWTQATPDSPDALVPGKPFDNLWVAVRFTGDGHSTAILEQLRIDFDHEGYDEYLPALYHRDPASRAYLHRLLAVFESGFETVEREIDLLPVRFDPEAAPRESLRWLAETIGSDFDAEWTEAIARNVIATAVERYGRRGTLAGLRDSIRALTGLDVRIEEPLREASWWVLPAKTDDEGVDARLGVSTRLVSAAPQGAVVGTSAVLHRSHLLTDDEFGEPLFADLAHRFTVRIAAGQIRCDADEAALRDVIEREKPGHTAYHLCVVRPGFRVGFQARLGIDAVVGAPETEPGRLGVPSDTGGLVLAGTPPGRLGQRSTVGQTTRLGTGALHSPTTR
jgi:phage tail-like protein